MPDHLDTAALRELLRRLRDLLAAPRTIDDALPKRERTTLRDESRQAADLLVGLGDELEPFKQPESIFDPGAPQELGRHIGIALYDQPRHPLGSVPRVYGSGVYAIYYRGNFPAYKPISRTETPIYVGKASPRTRTANSAADQGAQLFERLKNHAASIDAATNLSLAEFDCRFLVVRTAWERTAEDYLIHRYTPVWNKEMKVCMGFGKHGDSAEVRANTRSAWDTLHMGRPWAADKKTKTGRKTATEIRKDIAEHYRTHPPVYPRKEIATSPGARTSPRKARG